MVRLKASRWHYLFLFFLAAQSGLAKEEEYIFNTQDFAPFSEKDGKGNVIGPGVDVISAVCANLKAKCAFRLLPWTRAQEEVKEGKAHGMFLIGWNKERESTLYFSLPILQTEYGFFAHADDSFTYKDPTDLDGKKIRVYGPSNTSKAMDKLTVELTSAGKKVDVKVTDDDKKNFMMAGSGSRSNTVDAIFSNRDVGNTFIRQFKLKLRYAGCREKLNYFVAFSKQVSKDFVDRFNAELKNMRDSGKQKEILDKYEMTLPNDSKTC